MRFTKNSLRKNVQILRNCKQTFKNQLLENTQKIIRSWTLEEPRQMLWNFLGSFVNYYYQLTKSFSHPKRC